MLLLLGVPNNLALNIRDCLSVSFGGDTLSRRSLLSGVYARGSKRSHPGVCTGNEPGFLKTNFWIFRAVHDISRTFDFLTPLKPPWDPRVVGWVKFFLAENESHIWAIPLSNQSLLTLFRTTHLRFGSNFAYKFTSMREATVPNFRKIVKYFSSYSPPKN